MGICTHREWKDNSGISIWRAAVGLRSHAWMAGKCFWITHTQESLLYHSLCLPTMIQTTRTNLGHAGQVAVQVRRESSYGNEGKPSSLLLAMLNIYESEAEKRLPASPLSQCRASSALYTLLVFLHHLYTTNTALTSPQIP